MDHFPLYKFPEKFQNLCLLKAGPSQFPCQFTASLEVSGPSEVGYKTINTYHGGWIRIISVKRKLIVVVVVIIIIIINTMSYYVFAKKKKLALGKEVTSTFPRLKLCSFSPSWGHNVSQPRNGEWDNQHLSMFSFEQTVINMLKDSLVQYCGSHWKFSNRSFESKCVSQSPNSI